MAENKKEEINIIVLLCLPGTLAKIVKTLKSWWISCFNHHLPKSQKFRDQLSDFLCTNLERKYVGFHGVYDSKFYEIISFCWNRDSSRFDILEKLLRQENEATPLPVFSRIWETAFKKVLLKVVIQENLVNNPVLIVNSYFNSSLMQIVNSPDPMIYPKSLLNPPPPRK